MKISAKEYIDNQFEWNDKLREADRRYFEAEISSMRRAVDKYSQTNDEWKGTHNNLQRQMQEQGKEFVKGPQLWAIVVGVATFCLGIAMYLKR